MSGIIKERGRWGRKSAGDRAAHDVFQSMLRRKLQADSIAPRQLQWRARTTGVIDRTNGVNDMLPVT